MMVTFVSQCEKNALKKTRRVLDAFANRIGDNTWQTVITEEGLLTVKKMLRRTASKNTAVSCHWIRSRSRSQFLWVVGNKRKFDGEGRVPVNSTKSNQVKLGTGANWYTLEEIKLLSQFAALMHDLGKASIAFQNRLLGKEKGKNLYRHEWVSLRMFLAFVGQDDDEGWLGRMISPKENDSSFWVEQGRFWRDGIDKNAPKPFSNLPPLASAIGWLIVTHHRLPVVPVRNLDGEQQYLGKRSNDFNVSELSNLLESMEHDWNELAQTVDLRTSSPYWTFNRTLPTEFPMWRKRASKLGEKIVARNVLGRIDGWLDNPYVMHLSRLSLMLADHHYSSLLPDSKERVKGEVEDKLYANTHSDGSLKQNLTEHLLGVARLSASIAHSLPFVEKGFPRLGKHKRLEARASLQRFRWQNKAADCAASIRKETQVNGAFIINMASTGCGKTLANARILYYIADPEEGMRATFALGLRTLTLQTGRSFQDDLKLGEDDIAIRVGGSASKALFEYYESIAEKAGSGSVQDLLEEDGHIVNESTMSEHRVWSKVLGDQKIQSLVTAPILVCTIDHLMPATEAQRAGRQIAPMLRLMSSDLVLDELDDFDIKDLPALTRIVYWAGLLGSRLIISSATLPPAIVEGMYLSYMEGRRHFSQNRCESGGMGAGNINVPCMWVDEFGSEVSNVCDRKQFEYAHNKFIKKRVESLDKAINKDGAKRRGILLPLALTEEKREDLYREFAEPLRDAVVQAHEANHEVCPLSGKRVSFGLVRMANIEPLIGASRALFKLGAPENYRFHICVYHSRFPLLLRSAIENRLDTILNRRVPDAVYKRPDIRALVDASPEENHLFVVLGSPVTEVGRDHDYDWAVVEPSSVRSLIQLAGRVQRHRLKKCESPNVFIFNKNLRHFYKERGADGMRKAVFIKPGFEDARAPANSPFRLFTHKLEKLLDKSEYGVVSAKPRIQPRSPPWQPRSSLVDLEHARLSQCMLPDDGESQGMLNAASVWQYPRSQLTWVLPQQQPFRENTAKEETLVFLPDEDQERLVLHRIHQEAKGRKPAIYTSAESQLEIVELDCGRRVGAWGKHDLAELLVEQAEAQGLSLVESGKRFSLVNVPQSTQGWGFHPVLGFSKRK